MGHKLLKIDVSKLLLFDKSLITAVFRDEGRVMDNSDITVIVVKLSRQQVDKMMCCTLANGTGFPVVGKLCLQFKL